MLIFSKELAIANFNTIESVKARAILPLLKVS